MFASEGVKKTCYAVATLGSFGEWPIGGVVASTLSIPLMFLLRSVYWLNSTFFYWVLAATLVFFCFVLHVAKQHSFQGVVLNKLLGGVVVLIGVPLRWRIVIFGFILFHILSIMKPFWWYKKVLLKMGELPGFLGITVPDLFSGMVVNIFLQLIIWVILG